MILDLTTLDLSKLSSTEILAKINRACELALVASEFSLTVHINSASYFHLQATLARIGETTLDKTVWEFLRQNNLMHFCGRTLSYCVVFPVASHHRTSFGSLAGGGNKL